MPKIIFLGDSITKGTDYGGVTVQDTFAYKVGINAGYQAQEIINVGVSSDTTHGALARLNNDVISKSPDVCVIMLGANDYAKGVSVIDYVERMKAIIFALLGANIKPVVLHSVLNRGSKEFINGYRFYIESLEIELDKINIKYIDLIREYAYSYLYLSDAAFKGLYVDLLHQTKNGHEFITNICLRHIRHFVKNS